ncbi:DUF2061 domain-containing protein [Olleya namhaensis]|uniref:DUF2061 domain-containing protein n=1 Tax=Olleya namhaensis TaxID=1144750 RepID=UPI002492C193|nr:DUF2061 domain-containing protein [Olleya namhaensis]
MENVINQQVSLEREEVAPSENIKRSLVKTISWRAVGTITTVAISYIITGTMALAFSIGGIELISKMVLYFFHERAWEKIKWGK